MNIARGYYSAFMSEYNSNRRVFDASLPKLPAYDHTNWRFILGLPPDFMLTEEDLDKFNTDEEKKKKKKRKRRRNRRKRKRNRN